MQRIFQFLLKSERYVTASSAANHTKTKVRTKYSMNKNPITATDKSKVLTQSSPLHNLSADLTTTASKPALTTNPNYCEKTDKSHGELSSAGPINGSETFTKSRLAIKKARKLKRYFNDPDLETMEIARDFQKLEAKLANLRQWEHTPAWDQYVKEPQGMPFTLLSYNILAQNLLEAHPYLYRHHDGRALPWNHRNYRLVQEILSINPQILCLQEVQESHLPMFEQQLSSLDLSVLYKKRTGFKDDGCAIFYNRKLFNLIEYHTIEYYQPNCQVCPINLGLLSRRDLTFSPLIASESRKCRSCCQILTEK